MSQIDIMLILEEWTQFWDTSSLWIFLRDESDRPLILKVEVGIGDKTIPI